MRHLSVFLALATFAAATLSVSAQSNRRGRVPPNLRDPAQLDEAEGARILRNFRNVRLAGDFLFRVNLVYQPHRGETVTYTGRFGGEFRGGMRTRVDLEQPGSSGEPLRFLQWNGPEPRLWKFTDGATVDAATDELLFQPLLPGITIRPFDVQMPFIYWDDYAYEGSGRLKGRPIHYFLLYPPEDDARYADIGAVRVALDEDYNAALRAEVLDGEGDRLRRIEGQGIKKVDDQWIVSRIDLIDFTTRDRTILRVTAARVGLDLPAALFTPAGLAQPFPEIELEEF